jgi:hypothetical protein
MHLLFYGLMQVSIADVTEMAIGLWDCHVWGGTRDENDGF